MEDKTAVTITALIVLCVIECMALIAGINGQMLMVVLVIIASSIGVPIGLHVKEKTTHP